MQDNHGQGLIPSIQEQRRMTHNAEMVRAQNIAANGRWGTLAMGAVSLYIDQPKLAFFFALVVLVAHLVEQMPTRYRAMGYTAIALLTAAAIVFLALFITWR